MIGTATLSTNNAFGQDRALQDKTTFVMARNIREKLLQFGDNLVNAADVNRSTTNAQTNSTPIFQFLIFLDIASESVISSISRSWFVASSVEETAQTYVSMRYLLPIVLPEINSDYTDEEERKWNVFFSRSDVQAGLERLAEEAERQIAAGEIEEGGFAVE